MSKIIFGITGTIGAGKGTIVDYLMKEKGFKHFSVRSFLTEEIKKRGMEINRDSMVAVANDLRTKYSPAYIVEELYKQSLVVDTDCVIESIRAVGEVNALRGKQNFFLLAVDADKKVRYERILARSSETDQVSFEEFAKQEDREMTSTDPTKQNLSECIKMADFRLINNGSFQDIYGQVDKIIQTYHAA